MEMSMMKTNGVKMARRVRFLFGPGDGSLCDKV